MKNVKRYFVLLLSLASFASTVAEQKSIKVDDYQIIEPTDSNNNNQTFYQKLQWGMGLGITKNGPIGLSVSTSLFYPIHKNIRLKASSGLVLFRGPSFEYRTEYYFNDGSGYGYFVDDYLIGNFLAHQFSIGAVITEPVFKKFNLSFSLYQLRLLRSSYINHTRSIRSSGESRSYSYGVHEDDVSFISPFGSNYGFSGIHKNNFGLQIGVGYQGKRIGLSASTNLGFRDWRDNSYFGSTKESSTFSNIQLTYLLKK